MVEGLEDVDVHSEEGSIATQVKYFESGHYATPATLRKPIMLMLDAFAAGADYSFILHVYFGDGSVPPASFSVEELRTCLTEHKRKPKPKIINHFEKYSEQILESFITKLTIRAGLARDEQLKQVVESLAQALGCHVDEASELHYGNALKRVQDLAMAKKTIDRKTKLAEFLVEINKRSSLYTRWHAEVIGQDRYVKALAGRIKSSNSLKAIREKAIELTVQGGKQQLSELADLIEYLATTAYGVRRLSTTKAWTILLNGTKSEINTLKSELLSRGIVYEDGFEDIEFQPSVFARNPVINTTGGNISKTSYDIRLVNIGNINSYIDHGYKFDIVIITTKFSTRVLANASRFGPIELLGLEQSDIKKILELNR